MTAKNSVSLVAKAHEVRRLVETGVTLAVALQDSGITIQQFLYAESLTSPAPAGTARSSVVRKSDPPR